MQSLRAKRITIVGTGLLGGSLGLALRAAGYRGRIVGVGRSRATLDQAEAVGCIDRGTTDLAEGVAEADLVVLATPVGTILKLLPEVAAAIKPGAVVTDVGSTKQSIVARGEQAIDAGAASEGRGHFMGSHPMAGGADTGPEAADAQLFAGKPVIITPTDRTDADALAEVEQLWQGLGMRICRMGAAEHDRAVARISHMPHAAAVMLVALAEQADLEVASTGFDATTRLAAGDPGMWTDIFLDNAEALEQVLGDWRQLWQDFERLVGERDREGLMQLLRQMQAKRRGMDL